MQGGWEGLADSFNFDDFDTDNLDEGLSEFDDAFDSGISSLGNDIQEEDTTSFDDSSTQNEGDTKITKTAIIAIVLGFVVILLAFFGMKTLKGTAEKKSNISASSNTVSDAKNSTTVDNTVSNNVNSNKIDIESSNSSKKDKDWKAFESSEDIVFNDDYVDSIFTVISTKNYVKVVNSENELLVKTVVTGSLSGFTGTYELELPYYKGSQLLPGNNFKVEVQIGNFKENIVVGEIVY